MDKTKERFREMLNDIFERDGIKTFKQLAEMSGISQNTFTRIKRNEVKEVDIETFRKLNSAFDDRYNPQWFQGDSPYMLIKDYQNAQKNRQTAIPEYASLLNAALASKDETIEAYQKRLEDKDVIIESLRAQLAEKDERIAELKAHNIDLRRQLDQYQNADIDRYPFPVGAAEDNKQRTNIK
jgi:transcriptional regulator with XRE-family HTH domain